MRLCGIANCENYAMSNLDVCDTHRRELRKAERLKNQPEKKRKAIPKFSKKRKDENVIYSERRILFLEGQTCAVFPDLPAVEVHHRKGRQGFADGWAKRSGISLLLDMRWWLAVSSEGHRYIGDHPQEAMDRGWSLSRLENLDQEKEII